MLLLRQAQDVRACVAEGVDEKRHPLAPSPQVRKGEALPGGDGREERSESGRVACRGAQIVRPAATLGRPGE
jgi:hypothetical protein